MSMTFIIQLVKNSLKRGMACHIFFSGIRIFRNYGHLYGGGEMAREVKDNRTLSRDEKGNCCRVESVVSVDERGQMVLPKDIRERAGIGPGEKLAIVSWEHDGKVCCISLVKAEAFTEMVQALLGPMMGRLAAGRSEEDVEGVWR